MAETKYDLLLHPGKKDGKIYNQPWYKERLRTKYIKSLKPTDTSHFLEGRNWMFVKDGLDDFRDGLPPNTDDIVIKGDKGLGPTLKGSSDDLSNVKQPAVRRRFNVEEICYSKVTPLQAQRREHIEEIEYGLTQHPLALYPHLEECLPPEVFEDVVDILDPEMNLVEEGEGDYDEEDEEEEEEGSGTRTDYKQTVTSAQQHGDKTEHELESEEPKVRNPYRWLPRKDEKDKKDKKKSERRSNSPSQDEHINHVTQDFCEWVASLGGESNNIEESTITSLFASGYETKPALSVPIHVVELTNVPPELRMSATVPPPQPHSKDTDQQQQQKEQKQWSHSGGYQPSWVKLQYGAWYLPAHTWKKRQSGEPLQDPQELKDQQMSEAKKKSNDLDQELAPMHGAKAFVEFIDTKKTVRKPEFLERVGEIQEQQRREEQAKLEAELAKQKKRQARTQAAKSASQPAETAAAK